MAVNPYVALKEAYLNSVKKAQANEQNQLKQNYNTNLNTANQQYDKNANNAYVTYKQSLAQLPEQLSNQGLTGGASESANIKLQTAYSNNLNNNEMSRQSTVDRLTNDYNTHLGDLNNAYLKQIAGDTADYDRLIANWNDDERKRQEEASAARSYGGGGYGGYSYGDYSSYDTETNNPVADIAKKAVKTTKKAAKATTKKKGSVWDYWKKVFSTPKH